MTGHAEMPNSVVTVSFPREENSVILIHEFLENELHIVPVRATSHGKIKQR
jgi:hypothetical protein